VADIVIQVPVELKPVADAIKTLLTQAQSALGCAGGGPAREYGSFEDDVEQWVAAVERSVHKVVLSSLDVDAPRVLIDGRGYSRVMRCEAEYNTKAGPVPVMRSLYRSDGKRNGHVVDAVSLRAGVVGDGWLPHAAKAMAHLLQQGTSREAEATAQQMGRLPYSRSSFERVGHEVGVLIEAHRIEVDDALAEALVVPAEAASVSLSMDRVSIPMEEPRTRPTGRPRKDAPKRPVARVFRMAYCATVTLHDSNGESLRTISYGSMPESDPATLCSMMTRDAAAILEQRPDLKVALLADGAPEMWGLLESQTQLLAGRRVAKMIDLWHVLEKLGKAARVIYGADEADAVLRRWRFLLLNRTSAVRTILDLLIISGCEHARRDGEHPVHDTITYLSNNGDRMQYVGARRAGLPLGSGNVEATGKSLVEQRMKRAGARWKHVTGQHILQLRALALSDRWQPAMNLTLRHQRKSVVALQHAAA
jgi:hypothetical protein